MKTSLEKMNTILTSYYLKPTIRYIANERLCPKCAKEKWSELGNVQIQVSAGICGKCKKVGIVAYIDEEIDG